MEAISNSVEVLDPPNETEALAKRTVAEVSRANGAKSRGPITVAGKRRSSMNAITHGILAKHGGPLADPRAEDKDFQGFLAGLIGEFQPETQTEQNLCELLAADYVVLGRILRAREMAFDNGKTEAYEPLESVAAAQMNLRLGEQMLASAEQRLPFKFAPDELEPAKTLILRVIEQLQMDAERHREHVTAGEPPDEAPGAEGARLYRKIRPGGLGVFNDEKLLAILRGESLIDDQHWGRWQALLGKCRSYAQWWIERAQEESQRYERQCRQHQIKSIGHLPALMTLDDYEIRRRRSIERTTAFLMQLKRIREAQE